MDNGGTAFEGPCGLVMFGNLCSLDGGYTIHGSCGGVPGALRLKPEAATCRPIFLFRRPCCCPHLINYLEGGGSPLLVVGTSNLHAHKQLFFFILVSSSCRGPHKTVQIEQTCCVLRSKYSAVHYCGHSRRNPKIYQYISLYLPLIQYVQKPLSCFFTSFAYMNACFDQLKDNSPANSHKTTKKRVSLR